MSFRQVRGTYELSQCNVISIIKLRPLGIRTLFSSTSILSLTFRQKSPLQSACLFTDTSMLAPIPNQSFNHAQGHLAYQASLYILQAYLPLHQVGKTHVLSRAALVLQYVSNQTNWQRLLPGLRREDLPVLRYWGVTLLKLLMFLKSLERSVRTTKQKKNVTTRV